MKRRGKLTSFASTWDSLRNDYDAAKSTRFRQQATGMQTLGSGADYHYRNETDHYRIAELAHNFDRNDMLVGQGVTRFINQTLKQGIRLDPDTGNADLDTAIVARWADWSNDPAQCDVAKEHRLHKLAQLAARARIFAGDIFALPTTTGALQLVEGYRCKTPTKTTQNVVLGVLLDPQTRERKEFWFTRDDVGPMQSIQLVRDVQRYPARDASGNRQVFHIYDPKRYTQTRGVSALAPAFDAISMHGDIHFATLVKQQVAACITIFRNIHPDVAAGQWEDLGAQVEEAMSDGGTRIIEELAPGLEVQGRPGETLQGFSPNIPSAEFYRHMMLVLTIISVNLGIPVQVMLLDPTATNFSGWRGAMDQAREGFRDFQDAMIEQFYRPVYLWKLRQWLLVDDTIRALAAKSDPFLLTRHGWIPPCWPYIEPMKDAQADELIISAGLDTRRSVLGRRGLNVEEVDRDAIEDNTRLLVAALTAADSINQQFDDADVTWRDVLNPYQRQTAPIGGTEPEPPTIPGDSPNGDDA